MILKTIYYLLLIATNIYGLYFIIVAIPVIFKKRHKKNTKEHFHYFEILIPARNEEHVIGNLINSLKKLNYDRSLYEITVVLNNSTDNTCEVVAKYQKDFSNLKYECNKYNIGGNANIVKAFYKATNEYVWVLADNDSFKWDSWKDVEVAIEKQSDAIIVANYNCPKWDIASLFLQTTFLPGVIYKRANIDDTVMCNMEFNISNMFPHLALSAKLFNENKNFTILDNPIINVEANEDENGEYTYTRGFEGYVHPLQRGMNWISGYANSLYLIKDKKIRTLKTHK